METDVMTIPNTENAASALPPATGSSNINVGTTERIISVLLGAAAAAYGLRNFRSPSGLAMTLGSGFLLSRGLTGYCMANDLAGRNTANKRASAMEIKGTYTINKPRAEVYAFWRRLENLPRFMKHLEEVKELDGMRSNWKAHIPGGVGTITWEAEITEDRAGELIMWSSLPGSTIDNAGEVRFQDAPGNKGTEIKAHITYRLPAGDLGSLAAKLFNPLVENMMKEDLRRFKSIIETGEVPTIEGQPSGRDADKPKAKRTRIKKSLQEEGPLKEETPLQDVKSITPPVNL